MEGGRGSRKLASGRLLTVECIVFARSAHDISTTTRLALRLRWMLSCGLCGLCTYALATSLASESSDATVDTCKPRLSFRAFWTAGNDQTV